MLASITPLGERGRGASWRRTVTAYVAASIVGGAVVGAALGALGAAVAGGQPRWLLGVVAAAAVLAAGLDALGRTPTVRRQVDEGWLTRYRDWVYGVGFGFQLGIAAGTIVTSAATYLTWCVELLTASAGAGAVIGATFGLARAVPLLSMRRAVDPESLRDAHRQWQARLGDVRRLTVAVEAVVGIVLVAVAA